MANCIQASVFLSKLQYLKLVFLNISNCVWKPYFLHPITYKHCKMCRIILAIVQFSTDTWMCNPHVYAGHRQAFAWFF